MAKGLRSKWRRQNLRIKRVRYGEKEAARLEKVMQVAKQNREENRYKGRRMERLSRAILESMHGMVEPTEVKKEEPELEEEEVSEKLSLEVENPAKLVSEKLPLKIENPEKLKLTPALFMDEHGNFPKWVPRQQAQRMRHTLSKKRLKRAGNMKKKEKKNK